jgi:adenosylcobinamide kinase/adenosylcobinamide-phosphate guanylyltransferase
MASEGGKLTLILGGARSGKSSYAEKLASVLGRKVLYVATAQALDDEMRARVQAHRQCRPPEWRTLEAPLAVAAALRACPEAADADLLLLDCLTLLVSNVILSVGSEAREPDERAAWVSVQEEIEALLEVQHQLGKHLVVVSNEVGEGVVPPYPLGRIYRDCLGNANQALARAADQVILMVAGLPVDVKSLPLAWPNQAVP